MQYSISFITIITTALLISGCTQNNANSQLPNPSDNQLNTTNVVPADEKQLLEIKVDKADNTNQKPFTINYPQDWKMSTSDYDNKPSSFLQFEKQDHKLQISNLPRGGGACLFKGDSDYEGPHADYREITYQEHTYSFGTLRSVRKTSYNDQGRDIIEFCQKQPIGFVTATNIGDIAFDIPKQAEQTLIEEMYKILENVKLTQ